MKKFSLFICFALLIMVSLTFNRAAFGWGSTGGDGSNFGQLQETAVFFNNAGTDLIAGQVVIIDRSGTGVSAGSTLGAYVKTTTTADQPDVAGIVKSRHALDQSPVVVVTKGPVEAMVLDSGDAVNTGSGVGTSTTAGCIGGGKYVGYALEAGDGTDEPYVPDVYIWVQPQTAVGSSTP